MAASATFALKAGVWFRRGRLLMVSPDSLGTACPLSGRNSTYRPVQISGAGSNIVVSIDVSQALLAPWYPSPKAGKLRQWSTDVKEEMRQWSSWFPKHQLN